MCSCVHTHATTKAVQRKGQVLRDTRSRCYMLHCGLYRVLSLRVCSVSMQNAGQLSEALQDFDSAVRLKPRSVTYRLNRAACRRALDDLQGCIDDLTHVLELQPGDHAAHTQVR